MQEIDHEIDPARVLTGEIVDIDLFVGGRTRYDLSDIRGKQHSFEIPNDLSFPTALALEHAYDDVLSAAADDGDHDTAWLGLCRALAACANVLGADIKAEWLSTEFGRNVLMHWVNVMVTRLQMQQAGATLQRFLEMLQEPPKVDDGGPKAPGSPGSSDSSDDSTDGAPTIGEPSGGENSGLRLAK